MNNFVKMSDMYYFLHPAFEWLPLITDKEFKKLPLKELFDIQIGLVEDKYGNNFEGMKETDRLFFVRLSSISHSQHSFKSLEDLIEEDVRISLKREKAGRLNSSKPLLPVPVARLMKKEDYLITSRGKLNGFSMNKVINTIGRPDVHFVPSHHFITLRPSRLLDFHIPYLHFILDSLIGSIEGQQKIKKQREWEERKEKYRFEYKSLKAQSKLNERDKKRLKMLEVRIQQMDNRDESGQPYEPLLNVLSIKDIEHLEIKLLWNKNDQEKLMEKHRELELALEDAKRNLANMRQLIGEASELPMESKYLF
jgi:hypothetical protein